MASIFIAVPINTLLSVDLHLKYVYSVLLYTLFYVDSEKH